MICFKVWLSLLLFLIACNPQEIRIGQRAVNANTELIQIAQQVLNAMQRQEGQVLSQWIHPEKGVRFSPSAFVDPGHDLVFSSEQIGRFWLDQTVYQWGIADASGEPIRLTPPEYVRQYVLDGDYQASACLNINDDQTHGTTVNNAGSVYQDGVRVEFFIPPDSGQGKATLDWVALRLVLEKWQGRWCLVAIIHDEWAP